MGLDSKGTKNAGYGLQLERLPSKKRMVEQCVKHNIEMCISCIERIFSIWKEAVLEQSLEGKRSFPGKERMWKRKNIPNQTESFQYPWRWYRWEGTRNEVRLKQKAPSSLF